MNEQQRTMDCERLSDVETMFRQMATVLDQIKERTLERGEVTFAPRKGEEPPSITEVTISFESLPTVNIEYDRANDRWNIFGTSYTYFKTAFFHAMLNQKGGVDDRTERLLLQAIEAESHLPRVTGGHG